MKNLINILFLLVTYSSFAQSSFAPTGASWIFPEWYFASGNTGIVKFKSEGDTVIQNKFCKVVSKTNPTCYISAGSYYFHQTNDSVFLYNEDLELFDLLYVFNAAVGDSWSFSASDGGWGDTMTCTVDSISYFDISPTDSLKIQHVTLRSNIFFTNGIDTFYYSYPTKLIEHIGFELALLPIPFLTICDNDYEKELRCYEDNEIGLINFSNVECLMTSTSTNEFTPSSNFYIFPNPTSSSFFIKNKNTNQEKFNIQLLNFQGIEVFQKQISISQNQNLEVATHHLPAGIYFLKIENTRNSKNYNNTFTIQQIIITK